MKKLVILRRLSQAFFLCGLIYILWSTTYPLTGAISPQVLFKIDPLIMLMTAISERLWIAGLGFSLLMIGLTFILGRFFCGWICPLGTCIDAANTLTKNKRTLKQSQNQKLRKVKFGLLIFVLLFAVVGIQVAWVMDPVVLVARFVSMNFIPTTTLVINKSMAWMIQTFDWYGPFYDFYRDLKESFLGVNIHYFANSFAIFLFFAIVVAAGIFIARLWCRVLCPLGALYAFVGKFSLLERRVQGCVHCNVCIQNCRMGAITDGVSYVKGECILCMDCIYDCQEKGTQFVFPSRKRKTFNKITKENGLSRRKFLFLLSSALVASPLLRKKALAWSKQYVLRPPGAQEEEKFVNTCVRCGNCMKVCITNGLQPTITESGWQGIWTPQLVPEIGYCEYNCTLCGEVCPTQAIPALSVEEKKKARIGIAKVDRSTCIAWADNKECIVCEEHCPVASKAIKTERSVVNGVTIYKPYVDQELCIGCGVCQNKCPVRPIRAIRVKNS